ncbi:TPA: hypothetical protein ACH3X1_006913 [Trebouxia sp. C0004]
MSVPRGPVYADQGLTLCCSCCYLSTHWQHQQLHRRLCAVPDKDQHDLLQVVNGIHLTAQALALSLGLSMDGLLHVTVASIKSLENPGKHHGSNTGQRLSMATAVITAMRHKKSLPANTSFFQVPELSVIAAMWRHGLFQCNDFLPFVVQQPTVVAAPSKAP